jgi:hypothetical protein
MFLAPEPAAGTAGAKAVTLQAVPRHQAPQARFVRVCPLHLLALDELRCPRGHEAHSWLVVDLARHRLLGAGRVARDTSGGEAAEVWLPPGLFREVQALFSTRDDRLEDEDGQPQARRRWHVVRRRRAA